MASETHSGMKTKNHEATKVSFSRSSSRARNAIMSTSWQALAAIMR
jgi:hypothetical protein